MQYQKIWLIKIEMTKHYLLQIGMMTAPISKRKWLMRHTYVMFPFTDIYLMSQILCLKT